MRRAAESRRRRLRSVPPRRSSPARGRAKTNMDDRIAQVLGVQCHPRGGVVHKCVLHVCQALQVDADDATVWAAANRLPYTLRRLLQTARDEGSAAVEEQFADDDSEDDTSGCFNLLDVA